MVQAADLYYKPWAYFWIIQSVGLLLLVTGIIYKISVYHKAKKQSLYKKPDCFLIIKALFRETLFQKQLAQKGFCRWIAHMGIFCGFAGLLLLSAMAVLLETVVPADSSFSLYMLGGDGHNYYKFAGDLFGLLILMGLIVAVFRRYILKDSRLYTDSGDTIALVILTLLVLSGLFLEAARIAIVPPQPGLQYSFVGYTLAKVIAGLSGLKQLAAGLWVFHSTLTAAFLAYIPHGKFLHIINSPVEIILNASEERMRGDLYI